MPKAERTKYTIINASIWCPERHDIGEVIELTKTQVKQFKANLEPYVDDDELEEEVFAEEPAPEPEAAPEPVEPDPEPAKVQL